MSGLSSNSSSASPRNDNNVNLGKVEVKVSAETVLAKSNMLQSELPPPPSDIVEFEKVEEHMGLGINVMPAANAHNFS